MDPEHRVSSSYKANLIFYNSGLERKEREKVFKEAGGIWNYDAFKKIILDRYEQKHELDCSMVEKAYKNRGRFDAAKTYVVHNPQENVDGADLFCEDCDEEYLDERVNLQQGFQPPTGST